MSEPAKALRCCRICDRYWTGFEGCPAHPTFDSAPVDFQAEVLNLLSEAIKAIYSLDHR